MVDQRCARCARRSAIAAWARISWASVWRSTSAAGRRRWRGRPRPAWIRIGTRRSAASANTGFRPALAEVERLRARVQLDPARAGVEAALGLGDRVLGQVEPAERHQHRPPEARPRPARGRWGRGRRVPVGVVEREGERPLDALRAHHRRCSSSGDWREAVLVDAEVGVRVPDPQRRRASSAAVDGRGAGASSSSKRAVGTAERYQRTDRSKC